MQVTINIPDNIKSLPIEKQEEAVLQAYRLQQKQEKNPNRALFLEALENAVQIETDMTEDEINEMIQKERYAVWEEQQAKIKTKA